MTKDGRATFQVDGLYFPDEETIYLKKKWNKNKPEDLELLIHELYHHVQNLNDTLDVECDTDFETPAFKVQLAYAQMKENAADSFDPPENAEKQFLMQGAEL